MEVPPPARAPLDVLPAQDATLWWVQTPGAPLQIGGLCLFEGAPLRDQSGALRLDDLRERVEQGTRHAIRFRQTLVTLPAGLGLAWVDDPHFDVTHHVHLSALPHPGGEDQLRHFAAQVLETPLDPTRPLWELWVVDGVGGDRVAVVLKASHVLADGMALLDVALRLLDGGSESAPAADRSPRPAPGAGTMLAAGLVDRARAVADGLWQAGSLLVAPRLLLGAAGSLERFARSDHARAAPLPITGAVGPHLDLARTQLPWDDIAHVKRAAGVTVNDVVLALTTGALATYLADHDGVPPGRAPRALVPVSTHETTPADEVRNRFSMMVTDLPLGIERPLDRLRAVHREMEGHKRSAETSTGTKLFALAGLVPPWVLRLAGPVILRNQPLVNLAVTNLPGAREPVHLLGSRLLEVYPLVGGTGNIAVIVGVLSYAGALGVCVTVDADVVDDVDRLVAGFPPALRELRDAVDGEVRLPR
jgi:WS/DGAT/MGAT family acyltransferase